MKNITKVFNDNVVLKDIDFKAAPGKVHVLIGENGAGKSTLMKILAGLYSLDEGDIYIDEEKVHIDSPKEAQNLGIAMIYQEIRLFPDLDIAENVYIGREPLKERKWTRLIDWDRVYKDTQRYLDYFSLKLNPRTPVSTLSAGQQKFIEIIKAISQDARIIIMDEPTAALTEQEIDILFEVIQDIKKLGVIIIYISHRIDEIKQIADMVTILRDGELIRTCPVEDVNVDQMVKAMVGRELKDRYPKLKVKIGETLIRVKNLDYEGRLKNINFDVGKGEIFGITGLSGSGRRTLARVLFGIEGPYQGNIVIKANTFKSITPHIAMENGLSYVTGIGSKEGLISNSPISHNITVTNLKRISQMGILNSSRERNISRDLIDRLEISSDEGEIVNNLSGGKQKKVIFAKWLFNNGRILMIDEPTAGIDIGSKVDIYNIINELVLSGASVIMISSDLPEIMGMCDRVAVMYKGQMPKIFHREEVTQEKIMYFASGGKKQKESEN
ncbi:MAG TPA: sugar ABC transporter ATP-binding protein [Clostridia bacterium]|nr:sugar ABC transporter ATP-binding protein [Clostridia bacterium]